MCGIAGYVGSEQSANILFNSLARLEYRGYDSAGMAVHDGQATRLRRTSGKLSNLVERLQKEPLFGTMGIAHTRWATHGSPSERNAHPHQAGRVTLVHNGIIENHRDLRARLQSVGRVFRSDTDTEVLPHQIDYYLQQGNDTLQSIRGVLAQVRGSYAIAVINQDESDRIYLAANESPLVIGFGENGNYVASDVPALLPYTRKIVYLRDGEIAVLTDRNVLISTFDGTAVVREPVRVHWDIGAAEKNGHRFFMHKEIHEQARVMRETLRGRVTQQGEVELSTLGLNDTEVEQIEKIEIVACGTSNHAGIVAKYWFEELVGIPVETEIASEYRYRKSPVNGKTLFVTISQSGETADTLAALKLACEKGAYTIAICNVVDSSIPRHADSVIYTQAGPEIGVASTKAFVTQLSVLFLLAVHLGRVKGTLSEQRAKRLLENLEKLPDLFEQMLSQEDQIIEVAKKYHHVHDWLFLGRWLQYPIALEGALKLKEISYAHAEGLAAGEMKHGPIALIDENAAVVSVCTQNRLYEKTLSNLQEVKSRSCPVIALGTEQDHQLASEIDDIIWIPKVDELLEPLATVLPLQLLAYHIAVLRDLDVDQPRNLAKSVTVE